MCLTEELFQTDAEVAVELVKQMTVEVEGNEMS